MSHNQWHQRENINEISKKLLHTSSQNNQQYSNRNSSNQSSQSDKEPPGNENEQKAAVLKLLIVSAFIYGVLIYPMQKNAYKIEVISLITTIIFFTNNIK